MARHNYKLPCKQVKNSADQTHEVKCIWVNKDFTKRVCRLDAFLGWKTPKQFSITIIYIHISNKHEVVICTTYSNTVTSLITIRTVPVL